MGVNSVSYSPGSAGDQAHTSRQEPHWRAAVFSASAALSASTAAPAQVSTSAWEVANGDRNGTFVQGTAAKQKRIELTAISDGCLY